MKPTEKQRRFIAHICFVLNIEMPNCETKEIASKWIENHIEDFEEKIDMQNMYDSTSFNGVYGDD